MDEEFGLDADDGFGPEEEGLRDRVSGNIKEITSLLVTGIWLSLLFVGPDGWWLVALIVGYVVVVPLVAILAGEDSDEDEELEAVVERVTGGQSRTTGNAELTASNRDALEELRLRYANGDLTDEQFERKVERLLETETIEDARKQSRQRDQSPRNRETE